MKNEAVFLPEEAIMDFLVQDGKGSDTKDYEFIAAVAIKRFCEKQWGQKCKIGFKVKPEYSRLFPKTGSITLPVLVDLLRRGINEYSSVDFVVGLDIIGKSTKGEEFQVKRFGFGNSGKDTEKLISYLNSLMNKYSKTDTNLVIFLGKDVEVEFVKLKVGVNIKSFPFKRIMMVWTEDNKICIGEIFPAYGMEEYNLNDFLK